MNQQITPMMETLKAGKTAIGSLQAITNRLNQLDVNRLPAEWRSLLADYVDSSKDLADCFVSMSFHVSKMLEHAEAESQKEVRH
jgi:hypothetical protein